MYHAFNEAKAIAMKRMANPRIVPMVFYRDEWEEQEATFGPDPWEYGLTDRNRRTLDVLAGYVHEQGQTRRRIPIDELFINIFQGRERGAEARI
jgi:4,5-dihydroxyphthalate decarboxylase